MNKFEVIEQAVNFWIDRMRNHPYGLPPKDLETFSAKLKHSLSLRLESCDVDCGGFISLRTDYGPDGILKEVSKFCGISRIKQKAIFPMKTRMRVYSDRVEVAGYQEWYQVLDHKTET